MAATPPKNLTGSVCLIFQIRQRALLFFMFNTLRGNSAAVHWRVPQGAAFAVSLTCILTDPAAVHFFQVEVLYPGGYLLSSRRSKDDPIRPRGPLGRKAHPVLKDYGGWLCPNKTTRPWRTFWTS